ncbi:OmpA family protein [Acetobacter okinawensis]|uniref:OmpA family protein n=1 Tax=Acetobacter okinawensis TaxID=1076594 RepID=UPI0004704256|nr:OmpA family protein [Acetobacter okinawensis]
MRLRTALLVTTLMAAAPAAASATTITGPYVDLGGGYDLTQTQHFKTNDDGDVTRNKVGHKSGWTGYGSVGWGFGNGLRAEVEGTYLRSNLSGPTGNDGVRNKGKDSSYGGFVNALYDFDLAKFGINNVPVTPFIGAGAGYLWTQEHHSYTGGGETAAGYRGTKGGFAYQAIVGAAFDTGIPGFQVTAQYRLIGQPGTFRNGQFRDASVPTNETSVDHRFNHLFMVGLRYAFDTAPPPPPPAAPIVAAPAPLPARSYLVFFDWDKSVLSARARQIVAEAAQASTHVQTTRIEVNGYTDNSAAHPGPRGEKYNLGLSLHRAESVKAELIHDGVPAAAIDIHGYGEAHPLVPTGPNTREPQNRRVEIILH